MTLEPKASVLVVDDEDALRRGVQRTLERAGYRCSSAPDARTALDILASDSVDLVMTDVNMPGESGMALARTVTLEHANTAVVMVTGVDDPGVAKEALELGAYGYVIKPFDRNELLITVNNALHRRELEIENRLHRARLEELVAVRTASLEQAIRDLTRSDEALRRAHEETIQRLAMAAEFRDETTGRHLRQMSRYSELLARHLGLGEERAELVRLASPLHDVGKIGVPDSILQKAGSLTDEEWDVMRTHPELGHRMLADSETPELRIAAEIALTHHERWDGSGYPRGLRGSAIPVEARIVAVADVFDALTSERPYKRAFDFLEAVEVVTSERGAHFDPEVVDLFVGNLDEVADVYEGVTAPISA